MKSEQAWELELRDVRAGLDVWRGTLQNPRSSPDLRRRASAKVEQLEQRLGALVDARLKRDAEQVSAGPRP